jgi:ribosomal protein L37AE/L43A
MAGDPPGDDAANCAASDGTDTRSAGNDRPACPACGGQLVVNYPGGGMRCRSCGRTFSGEELRS